jgi:hypothetical protein
MPMLFSFKNNKEWKNKTNSEYYALVNSSNKSVLLEIF